MVLTVHDIEVTKKLADKMFKERTYYYEGRNPILSKDKMYPVNNFPYVYKLYTFEQIAEESE